MNHYNLFFAGSNGLKAILLMITLLFPGLSLLAADPQQEVVSFKCGLAIDAVFAELDTQVDNPVTQEALDRIDESNGEFVCITADESNIFVKLQAKDMGPTENRLVFTVNTRTYRVVKTLFGR
ncbi:MAG: hypothetical protein GY935_13025 [Gammaproteobacteria bacterium]|nr:hypothetical protein [Gammaproteobacteria bacterium]